MGKVRWGVVGYGSIAGSAVVPAIKGSYNGELLAVASRSPEAAEQKAHECGAARAYGSYEALLGDADVDAVYLALPTGLHESWALRCAEAGKHVLCETTAALSLAGAARMREAFFAKKLRLVEAFMVRHHPQWRTARSLVADGTLGKIVSLRAAFTRPHPDVNDHRWSPQLGGGALHTAAAFCVDVARLVVGADPVRVSAFAQTDGEGGVDATVHGLLGFPDGVLAQVAGSLVGAPEQSFVVDGTKARVVVERPFAPDWDKATLRVERDGEITRTELKGANQFLLEVEHFARLVQEPDRTALPAEDGVANAAVLEAMARSYATGRTVELR
jgi:predicted dehydrogenase